MHVLVLSDRTQRNTEHTHSTQQHDGVGMMTRNRTHKKTGARNSRASWAASGEVEVV